MTVGLIVAADEPAIFFTDVGRPADSHTDLSVLLSRCVPS
jgi:hypothetical protein